MSRRFNVIAWIGVIAIVALLWFFGARTHLHLVNETLFILLIGIAAIGLTAIYWWGIRKADQPPDAPPSNKEI